VRTAKTLIDTPVFVGSADCIKSHVADLVLANISVRILDLVAEDLQRIAKPGGILVLSGFLTENSPKLFRPRKVFKKGEWQCWICRPEDIAPGKSNGEIATHEQQWWL
jgi:ribosomal protein L11 methylase PrmA